MKYWKPEVGKWDFVYISDFASGHHYFVYTIGHYDDGLEILTYSVDEGDLKDGFIEDEELEKYLDETYLAEPELLVNSWLEDAAADFRGKEHFKYAPQFIKFIFKIILQKK